MAKESSVKELPKDLLAEVNKKIEAGTCTLDEIVEYLEEQGHPKSRSALGRYKKRADIAGRKLRQTREIMEVFGRELGDAAIQGKQGRLLVEMVRTAVFDLLTKVQEADGTFSPQDIANIGKGLAELGRALRFDQDFEEKIRKQVAEEERQKAAKAVDEVAKSTEAGLSAATIDAIKSRILGVETPA